MDTYELLLDQITPFLESQFSNLPEDLKERISQAGMGEKTEETPDGVEEFEWAYIEVENKYLTDEEAKEIEEGNGIRKGKGIRTKVKTEHYYIWDTFSALQREYKVARYDFENYPGFREKATSSKLVETITPHLESNFSHLPQEIKIKIAYVDIFQKWDEISTEQRKYLAQDFDFRMHPDCDKYCNLGLEQQSIPNKILFWQGLNPHRIASEQTIIETKIKELEEREVELEELLGYSNSNNEQESKQIRVEPFQARGAARSIPKKKVMASFQGIKWNYGQWRKNLGSPPQWLIKCRIEKGVRGNNTISSTWDPVEIAVALLGEGISEEELNRVFRKPELKDWVDAWKEKTYS